MRHRILAALESRSIIGYTVTWGRVPGLSRAAWLLWIDDVTPQLLGENLKQALATIKIGAFDFLITPAPAGNEPAEAG